MQTVATQTSTSLTRIIVATIIGNGFVAYDFTVYSFSAVVIGKLFFPAHNAAASLLLSLATFGVGFVMRPLGAIVIGHIADTRGRKAGLTLSLSVMTLSTWLIACLPTHAVIGAAATVLMVCARLLQGLASGGEIGPASASLMESVERGRRCYLVSWRGASQGAAAFAAALIGASLTATLSAQSMTTWGWRIPFVIGGFIGPVGWYLRRHMLDAAIAAPVRPTLTAMFTHHVKPISYGILMMAAPSISIYITVFYMPSYLVATLHRPGAISLLTASISGLAIMIATPLVGHFADLQNSRKPIQFASLVVCLIAAIPAFRVLTRGASDYVSLVVIVAYVAVALSQAGPSSVLMMEAFPRAYRAAGMSIIYSFGVTLFGGFSPLIVAWLIGKTHDPMVPAYYLMAAVCVTLIGLAKFPEGNLASSKQA